MERDATVRLNKQRNEPEEERDEDLDLSAEAPESESPAESGGDIPSPNRAVPEPDSGSLCSGRRQASRKEAISGSS